MAKPAISRQGRKRTRAVEAAIVRLSTKGQLTIPHEWRSRYRLTPGSPLSITEDEQGRLILTPLPSEWLTPTPELQALIEGVQQEMKRRNLTPAQIMAELKTIRCRS